jgi:inner membrane protein
MPSPVGHSLMGYLIYKAMPRPVAVHQWWLLPLYLFAANAADLDFLPGWLIGHPNRYHHGISHSIGFAILFALGLSLLLFLLKRATVWRNFAIFFCLYCSHIGLDYLSIDDSYPYGLPAFWPVSDEYYTATWAFLPGIIRSSSGEEFVTSLFSLHNLWAVSVEVLLLVPFILLMVFFKDHRVPHQNGIITSRSH